MNFDVDHEGRSGWTSGEILNGLGDWLNQTGPADSDNDGVDDLYDLCPNTVAFGYVDVDGCLIDEDGDGVDDFKDDCLGTTSGATVDENGCPVAVDEPRSFFESLSSGDRGAVGRRLQHRQPALCVRVCVEVFSTVWQQSWEQPRSRSAIIATTSLRRFS